MQQRTTPAQPSFRCAVVQPPLSSSALASSCGCWICQSRGNYCVQFNLILLLAATSCCLCSYRTSSWWRHGITKLHVYEYLMQCNNESNTYSASFSHCEAVRGCFNVDDDQTNRRIRASSVPMQSDAGIIFSGSLSPGLMVLRQLAKALPSTYTNAVTGAFRKAETAMDGVLRQYKLVEEISACMEKLSRVVYRP